MRGAHALRTMFRRISDRLPQLLTRPAMPLPLRTLRLESMRRAAALVLVATITILISINQERFSTLAAFGYIGAFLVMALSNATLILPAPGLIFIFALGNSLHPLLVGLSGGMGATVGELTGYIAGYTGVAIAENSSTVHRVQAWMERHGLWTIFVLSIIPNPLFDIAGILAGAARIPVWRFMGVAVVGKVIQASAIALAGSLSLTWVQNLLSG